MFLLSSLLPTLASDAAWTISGLVPWSRPSHHLPPLLSRDQIQPTILSSFGLSNKRENVVLFIAQRWKTPFLWQIKATLLNVDGEKLCYFQPVGVIFIGWPLDNLSDRFVCYLLAKCCGVLFWVSVYDPLSFYFRLIDSSRILELSS